MAFLTIAYLSGDPHPDVLEAWSLGRTWEWGNSKHPPLMGWVVYLWMAVFRSADWSLQLLAMTNSALALFLVCGFAFAAIVHPQRRDYFGSWAPWVSIAAGLALLAPHLHWLITTGASSVQYALYVHRGASFGERLIEPVFFLLGLGAAMALPAIAWLMIAGQRLRQMPKDFRALDSGLWLILLIGVGTVIFPIVVTAVLGSDLPSLWALQGLFLLVVPVVCAARFPVERFYPVNLVVLVLSIATVAVVVAAPTHAIYRNTHPFNEGRNFYRPAVAELTRQWHDLSDRPLPLVSGSDALALATAFYSADHPRYKMAWNPPDAPPRATLQRGWAAMCFSSEAGCIQFLDRTAQPFVRSEFTVQSTLMGVPGVTRNVIAVIVAPDGEGNAPGNGLKSR
jgi:hypothetical protein